MPQVRIATSVAPANLPPGTTLGKYRFRIWALGMPTYERDVDAPLPAEVVFEDVMAGAYQYSIQRLNLAGSPIGTAYTGLLTVAPPAPVVGEVPVGATVTVV